MRKLARTFLRGLLVVLPVGLTLYVIYWLGASSEELIGKVFERILPDTGLLQYRPGMGLVAALALITLIGTVANWMVFRRLGRLVDALLTRIPLVKTLYGGIRDLMDFVGKSQGRQKMQQVVLIDLKENWQAMGIVTQTDRERMPEAVTSDDPIAVYLPMSYQIGGYTLFLPRDQVRPVDMSIEDAMRYAMTAGMSMDREHSSRLGEGGSSGHQREPSAQETSEDPAAEKSRAETEETPP